MLEQGFGNRCFENFEIVWDAQEAINSYLSAKYKLHITIFYSCTFS